MSKTIVLLFCSAAMLGSPAAAASFSGPRFELRGGWDRTTLSASVDDGVDHLSGRGHKSGFNVGGEIGYDARLAPMMIAGVYGGIEGSTAKDCSVVFGNDQACLRLGRNLTLGGRLGAVVSPMAMLYVKGGYSNGQLRASYANADDPTLDFKDHANRGGYHFGAGGEMPVGAGYVRLEYVRTNYSGYKWTDPDVTVKLDGHRDQLLAGFGLRF